MSSEVRFATDTHVVLIPDGVTIRVPAGTTGWITQVLGGNTTVQLDTGRLVRVAAADVAAIGGEAPVQAKVEDGPTTPERIWDVLRTCYDPEIPHNIVDLGLVYEMGVGEGDAGLDVSIAMTLTAPGCGMGPVLVADVEAKVGALPGVASVKVDLVFDPPWGPERMSEASRLEMGMFW